jgi:hypothetical protein
VIKQKFSLGVEVNLPKDGFSLDELVIETKHVFEQEGMVGFLRVLLVLLDHLVYPSLLGKWRESESQCCDKPHFVVSQKENKQLVTSIGRAQIQWTRIRCEGCGKSIIPLRG